jgi:hypothetical protein
LPKTAAVLTNVIITRFHEISALYRLAIVLVENLTSSNEVCIKNFIGKNPIL